METSADKKVTKDQIYTKSTGSQIPKPHHKESDNLPQHSHRVQCDDECNEVSQDNLMLDDLASVKRAVWDGCAKWYYIGLELGLKAPTLDAIQETCCHDADKCFTATLKMWLSRDDLHRSWSHLADSLRASPVGLGYLAEKLSSSHTP